MKEKSFDAAIWAFIDKVGTQLISLVNTIILARILQPRDFGVIGMLYIFISISSAFIDSGMGGGLIRKQNLTQKDCSTFFYFNVLIAALLYIILFTVSPYIAAFYNEPLITDVLRIFGLAIIINSFSLIHKVLLVKDLRLKLVTRASLLSIIFSTTIAIVCALEGLGVWSLVLLQITQGLFVTLLLWRFSKWKPTFEFSKESFKELYSFGMGLFLANIINICFKNLYQPLIGKYFSVSYAGFYYQAKRLYEVPVLTLSSVVDSVTFPILVKYQDDKFYLKHYYQLIFKVLLYITVPIIVLLSLLSEQLVLVLVGEKWLFSVELLEILCISGVFVVMESGTRSLFKLQGKTKLIFKLELIKNILTIITILISYRYGIKALMIGIVINSAFSFLVNQHYTKVKIEDYKGILSILFIGSIMGAVVYFVSNTIHSSIYSLIISTIIGTCSYLFLGFLLKVNEQKWLISLVSNKFIK